MNLKTNIIYTALLAIITMTNGLYGQSISINANGNINDHADNVGMWVNTNADVYSQEYSNILRDFKVTSIRHGWGYAIMDENDPDLWHMSPCDDDVQSYISDGQCNVFESMKVSQVAQLTEELDVPGFIVLATDGINYTGNEDVDLIGMNTAQREEFYLDNARRVAEWAKTNNFEYFEIGNENDLPGEMVDFGVGTEWDGEQYGAFALKMAQAVKSVYPEAKCGINGGWRSSEALRTAWWDGILDAAPTINDWIDFVIIHKYEFDWNYDVWSQQMWPFGRTNTDNPTTIAANFPGKPIYVTEISGFKAEDIDGNGTFDEVAAYRGVMNVEMMGNLFLDRNIELAQHWGTRWQDNLIFRRDGNNLELNMMGNAHKAYTNFMKPRLVDNGVDGTVRYFASKDPADNSTTVWLVNHSAQTVSKDITIQNFSGSSSNELWRLTSPNNNPLALTNSLWQDGSVQTTSQGSSISFTATVSPTSVTVVTFEAGSSAPTTYSLTVNSGSGDGNYEAGTVVNISANGAPAGQQFDRWTGNTGIVANINSASTTVTMPAGNRTVTATYEDIPSGGGDGQVEVGTSSNNHTYKTVNLEQSYTNPRVVVGPLGWNGGDVATVRVRNVSGNSFQWRVDEWEYRDESHVSETVGYMVAENGESELAGGISLKAGSASVGTGYQTINFPSSFSGTPVVLAQVVTENEAQAVSVRVRNVTSSSFQMLIQEEENGGTEDGSRAHVTETVHWIAIEQGQNSGSGTAQFEVGSTPDNVNGNFSTHNFSQSYNSNNRVMIAHDQTTDGGDACVLRYRNLGASSVQFRIHEESSRDAETGHTTEAVGYIVLNGSGILSSGGGATGPAEEIAQGKTATQSSTLNGFEASRAVDGNTNGNFSNNSVTHTSCLGQDWWRVDLGGNYSIEDIMIWNRTDCCGDRLSNYDVRVLNSSQSQVWTNYQAGQAGSPTTVNAGNAVGRYVEIQLRGSACLSIAEVQVYGSPSSGRKGEESNALNLTLYPNPVQNHLSIDSDQFIQIDIHDLTGKKVFSSPIEGGKKVFNLSELQKGTYVAKLVYIDGSTISRIILKD